MVKAPDSNSSNLLITTTQGLVLLRGQNLTPSWVLGLQGLHRLVMCSYSLKTAWNHCLMLISGAGARGGGSHSPLLVLHFPSLTLLSLAASLLRGISRMMRSCSSSQGFSCSGQASRSWARDPLVTGPILWGVSSCGELSQGQGEEGGLRRCTSRFTLGLPVLGQDSTFNLSEVHFLVCPVWVIKVFPLQGNHEG